MKKPLWLPYLKEVTESKAGVITFKYKGGQETTNIKNISNIMIYGKTDEPFKFPVFEKLTRAGIPIIYTRRNIAAPMIIYGAPSFDKDDVLTDQIVYRENQKKRTHIARQLLIAKMTSMKYLIAPSKIPDNANIDELRNIEAHHAKRYWNQYFKVLGHPEWSRRGEETSDNPVAKTLDASSRFISGIILRWILYHNLSPLHGYFHIPSDYQSLVYDLMDPYRGIFEEALLNDLFVKHQNLLDEQNQDKLLNMAINLLKEKYNTKTYVPLTRQIVTFHELLHGAVLSLKYYVSGQQRKFLIPLPGKPNGGRPAKINFKLYGRHAGKTDFWKEAYEVTK